MSIQNDKNTKQFVIHIVYRVIYLRRVEYYRQKAKEYAKKWAYGRNPKYYNFDSVGGDCTSFVSSYTFKDIRFIHINGVWKW